MYPHILSCYQELCCTPPEYHHLHQIDHVLLGTLRPHKQLDVLQNQTKTGNLGQGCRNTELVIFEFLLPSQWIPKSRHFSIPFKFKIKICWSVWIYLYKRTLHKYRSYLIQIWIWVNKTVKNTKTTSTSAESNEVLLIKTHTPSKKQL